MKGYKAFNSNLTCRGFQYEVGKEYALPITPIPCEQGFHFCKTIADTYNYYPTIDETRICEIEATGDVETNDNIKYCTNKIKIVREIVDPIIKHCNEDKTLNGFCNTGDWNTGNRNTGDWNTGDCNTGNRNTGNRNTGNRNTGDWNTGDCNTGNRNTGNRNTGNRNTGDCNTGDWNTGNRNTGNRNTGDCNTGDWNVTKNSTGCFNTKESTIRLFNKDSNLTVYGWRKSKACKILWNAPSYNTYTIWISSYGMSDEEKEKYSSYKVTGGYLKKIKDVTPRQEWWDDLSDEDKKEVMNIPNFDPDIFYECTGIKV